MEGINFDDLKFKLEMNAIDNDIKNLKAEINESIDNYFIDENDYVYNEMMKNYTGKHVVYNDQTKTDFVHYNEYKNSFLDKFIK